jgi:hypothetical protein
MNRKSSSGPSAVDGQTPSPEPHKRHFDTFETQFFKDGEAVSASAEADHFDDLDDGKPKRFVPSRQFLIGVVVGSACLAVIGCVALWRSGGKSSDDPALAEKAPEPTPAPIASPPPPAPAADPASAPGVAPLPSQPQVAVAAPVPAPAPGSGEQPQAVPAAAAPPAVAPVAPAPAPAAAAPSPAPTVAAAPVPAGAVPAAAPSAAGNQAPVGAPIAAAPSPAAAVAPVPPAAATPPPAAVAIKPASVAANAVAGDASSARVRCKEIAAGRRQKDLLAVCGEAFAADPSAADVAVILAKAEFDKGHAAEALAWSQKALAADPNAADAYVFIGGAEQSAGHKKAAKDAYKRYLQLAPSGRYASDLRAIVGTL